MSKIKEGNVVAVMTLVACAIFIIISIVYCIWYIGSLWYCAFVPVSQMPGFCLVGR